TLIEALPQVLPVEDAEIAQHVERALRRQGIEIHTGARVGGVQRADGGVRVEFTDSKGQARVATAERLLSAVGVRGNVEGLGPEREIRRVNYSAIPGATFCRPEVASVGLTEARAREQGYEVKIGRFPFKVSGKGQATSETDGLVKVVVDARTGEVLGAHIAGG